MLFVVSLGIVFLNAGGSSTAMAASSSVTTPGGDWIDNNGNAVEAHDGGIIKVGSVYYLYGNDRELYEYTDSTFYRLNMYSSTDLVNWTFENHILTKNSDPAFNQKIVERPKIIYNESTNQFVMYFHYDNLSYSVAEVGVAVSNTVNGNYTLLNHFRPLNSESRDMGLFKDDDGSAYLISTISGTQVSIFKLTADYLGVDSRVTTLSLSGEGTGIFKRNGLYYLVLSKLTGWSHNDNWYQTAPSMAGPWSSKTYLANNTKTYESQITNILPIQGTQGTTYMYMGDRWLKGTKHSRYVWLPLEFNGNSMSLNYYPEWSIDTTAGTWQQVINPFTNLAAGKPVTASSYWGAGYEASKVNDGDTTSTRWSAGSGQVNNQWLEIDFGSSITFDKAMLYEYGLNIRNFRIDYYYNGVWNTAVSGGSIGGYGGRVVTFNPVTATKARLYMPEAQGVGSIYEWQLFNTAEQTAGQSFVNSANIKTERRNDFTGDLGMKVTIGSSPVTVTNLGRYYATGNKGTHNLKIVDATNGTTVASTSVNMAVGTADSNGFKYAELSTPVTLVANHTYYMVSSETNGGDSWYGLTPVNMPLLSTKNVAIVNSGIYFYGNTWSSLGGTNNSYIPLNFKFH